MTEQQKDLESLCNEYVHSSDKIRLEILDTIIEVFDKGELFEDVLRRERNRSSGLESQLRTNRELTDKVQDQANQLADALVMLYEVPVITKEIIKSVRPGYSLARKLIAAREPESKDPDPHYTSEIDPEYYM